MLNLIQWLVFAVCCIFAVIFALDSVNRASDNMDERFSGVIFAILALVFRPW